MEQTWEGGCHCGRIRFRATGDLAEATICNCSICTKKGFIHLIIPPENFELLSGRDDLASYRFNTGVANHTFCRHCGIHAFYTPRSHPDMVDVNVRCLDGIELEGMKFGAFDGRHWEDAAKERNWGEAARKHR